MIENDPLTSHEDYAGRSQVDPEDIRRYREAADRTASEKIIADINVVVDGMAERAAVRKAEGDQALQARMEEQDRARRTE